MNNLKEIVAEDLLFTNNIEDDRTNTYLSLNDYDWMQYLLTTRFRTEEQGVLEIEFEYFGCTFSTMKVVQTLNGEEATYNYSYSTDIFKKHIKEFLTNHMKAWSSRYAFNGEDEVISFFNEVLKEGTLTDGFHVNPDDEIYKKKEEAK